MASTVYFAPVTNKRLGDTRIGKIHRLCNAIHLADFVKPTFEANEDELVAIKAHFGEMGNDTYLHPTFARQVVDEVKAAGGNPFLTDTCTLYKSKRHNGVDHLVTAYRHGFTPYVVDAPIVIADGITGKCYEEVEVNLKHFKTVKIAQAFRSSSAMVVLSHFKGHMMGGFGGAIKNLAMGCASPAGKIDQHGRSISFYGNCNGCGRCVAHCPQEALSLSDVDGKKQAVLESGKCIGCYDCVTVCPQGNIGPGQLDEYTDFAERMTEYAYGAVKDLAAKNRVVYLTFIMNVTPLCDCAGWSDPALVPDIGILASTDPVAIDQAAYDLVKNSPALISLPGHEHDNCCGIDKFNAIHPQTKGYHQIEYAEEIGMGIRDYKMITL